MFHLQVSQQRIGSYERLPCADDWHAHAHCEVRSRNARGAMRAQHTIVYSSCLHDTNMYAAGNGSASLGISCVEPTDKRMTGNEAHRLRYALCYPSTRVTQRQQIPDAAPNLLSRADVVNVHADCSQGSTAVMLVESLFLCQTGVTSETVSHPSRAPARGKCVQDVGIHMKACESQRSNISDLLQK